MITASKRERLNALAEILYNFLPLDANSKNAVTFKTIFAESSVKEYLEGTSNKKLALQEGLTLLYRYHEKLPKIIIRKVIPAAIAYRKYKRNPLTRLELDQLSGCLSDLGIDMTKEISKINIDESIPSIVIPPNELIKRLLNHNLHIAISTEPLTLFKDGHFNESVRKASERFEDRVQELSGLNTSGRNLMSQAFQDDKLLNLESIELENKNSFIDGYRFMSMGITRAIRNIFSHGDEERRTPEECFEMLLLINWMFRFLKA